MTLALVLVAVGLLAVTALGAGLLRRSNRAAIGVATAGALAASGLGLATSLLALVEGRSESVAMGFSTALGPVEAGLDPLSAFFLVCVFTVSGLAAAYGNGYMRAYLASRSLAPAAASFNLLVAAMAAVLLARDAVLFLVAWEIMSLASFFLVTYESDREEVRRAGTTYLVASHAGVVFLLVLFVLLSRSTGRFDFDAWAAAGPPATAAANTCFVLALIGFGSKAGFWPVHVWLPDAHPAAPSHVSAVMSGVMIKMGIYGLVRMLELLGYAPAWWGGLLLGIGIVSGLGGVLHALAQHDLKRLLAYHSVENIGIIAMGLGIGLLGRSSGNGTVAFLGFAGALLHVLNHGLFKGLLFQGAGSVLHATGTRDVDQLGGLLRRMPHSAAAFLVGAVAICGLPPLNGFVSEWLIYVGAFRGAGAFSTAGSVAALFAIASLALIGGLAAACFVKAFGIVFLGEPRTEAAAGAHEATRWMTVPMWLGASLCAAIGVAAVGAVKLVAPVASSLAGIGATPLEIVGPVNGVVHVAIALAALGGGLALARALVLRRRQVASGPTWGCGYPRPTPRMQYTAASFSNPVLSPFAVVFRRERHGEAPVGFFPARAVREDHLRDRAEDLLVPAVRRAAAALARLGFLQRGRVQLYLTYVLATLVLLLVWQAVKGTP